MWLRDGERSSGMVIDLGAEAWSTLRRTAARSASARHGWRVADGSGGPPGSDVWAPRERRPDTRNVGWAARNFCRQQHDAFGGKSINSINGPKMGRP